MVILKNTYLTIETVSLGAELKSIKDMDGVEYLLDNEKFWRFTSPHLFPAIGNFKGNILTHQGIDFSLTKHGFARDSEFTVVDQDKTQITYELKSSAKTLAIYPFPFTFQVKYILDGKQISIQYNVKNNGKEEMPFSLGGHPAFLAPRSDGQLFTDYYLEFEEYENLKSIAINLDNGLLTRNSIPIRENVKILELDKNLFTIDTLLFQNLNSTYVSLKNRKDNKEVKVHLKDFPFLGIWTTLGSSPFVCIEPWIGHPDYVDEKEEFLDKEDSPHLLPGEEKVYSYQIDIL